MRRRLCFFLLAVASAAVWAQNRDLYLSTANRKALVIGNDAYTTAPALRNAVNDARDLAARLRELRFEVTMVTDANEERMDRAFRDFAAAVAPGDVAFVHFSGHGVQIEGDNYLIPVDFKETDEVGAKYHSFSASELHDRIAAKGAALKILTLDACRNNRFRSFRGGAQGLSAMSVGAEGSYLAFATAPGRVASDNPSGRNGLFTGALLEALSEQGLELDQVFRKVRAAVSQSSGGEQLPWTSSSVTGEFYFLPGERRVAPPPVDTARVEPPPARSEPSHPAPGPTTQSARVEAAPTLAPPAPSEPETTEPRPSGRRAGDVSTADIRGVPMEFVWIPAGEFQMGCSPGDNVCLGHEKPRHRVRITKGFEMGKYEVTQGQWEAVMGSNPSFFKGVDRPVETVSWEDVQEFLGKLNAKGDGYRYRLPTEAEWEYASRAGTTLTRYGELDAIGWYDGNSGAQTQPVGGKQANGWGLHDMLGNVWEWCQDWYGEGYYKEVPAADPTGPARGESRTLRGGAWSVNSRDLRCSYRDRGVPDVRLRSVGFRCVREAN